MAPSPRSPRPAPADEPGLRDLLAVPGYGFLLASSGLWHTTRWGALFSVSYLLTQIADSPLINQAVGALIFAPMLFGGVLAGVMSDRVDRRMLIMRTQLALIPISVLMFALVQSGHVRVWMTAPFMFAVGIGGLLNMTAQRPLIYETVGPRLAGRALTIETIAQGAAGIVGILVCGALIQAIGTGASFAGMAALLCCAAALWRKVPSPQAALQPGGAGATVRGQVRASLRLLHGNPRFVAMLGITVIFNLFYSSFMPLVPVVAKEFEATALVASILSAGTVIGQLAASGVLTSRNISHHGRVFAAGAAVALVGLGLFASIPVLGIAILALLLAGAGQAAFGAMQALLAIESAGPRDRGTALGLLSTAIGSMPLGMLVVGIAAELMGTRPALVLSSLVGLAALGALLTRSADLLAVSAPPAAGAQPGAEQPPGTEPMDAADQMDAAEARSARSDSGAR